MRRSLMRGEKKRRALVLVLVLFLIGLLSVVLLGFSYRARLNLDASSSTMAGRQALACADAGISVGIQAVCSSQDLNKLLNSDLLSGKTPLPVGEAGQCLVWVSEENAKLNVNKLKSGDQPDRAAVESLLSLVDQWNAQAGVRAPLGYGVVPAMVDWVDKDDEVTYLPYVQNESEGAEESWYEKQTPPGHCGNAPFGTVSELLQVKGMTREALEGRAGGSDGKDGIFGLRSFLTTCGDGTVDLNFAAPEVLNALSPKMTPTLAQAIVDRRTEHPFVAISEVRLVPGMTDELFLLLNSRGTVTPGECFFRIRSEGTASGAVRGVELVVKRGGERGVQVISREEF